MRLAAVKAPMGSVSAGTGTQGTLPQTGPEPVSGSASTLQVSNCAKLLFVKVPSYSYSLRILLTAT